MNTRPSEIKAQAAELSASMKVMATLHRANEDVAAADEFAQGADLVAAMAAEIERLQADAERFAFFAHVAVNDDLHEKLEPHMPTDAEQPDTIEAVRDHMDLCIQAAKAAGLWPVEVQQ